MKFLFSSALSLALISNAYMESTPPTPPSPTAPFTLLHDGSFNSEVINVSVKNTTCSGTISLVAALRDGAIEYYDGANWQQLHNDSWAASITQMNVNWSAGTPQIVVGLSTGAVEYYQNGAWSELLNNSSAIPVIQMSVDWSHSTPRVIIGLASGQIEYYVGGTWTQLQSTIWDSPITQINVDWSHTNPRIIAALGTGNVEYYTAGAWSEIRNYSWDSPVTQMAVDWSHDAPRVVVGLGMGSIEYYNGGLGTWTELQTNVWNRPVQQLAVNWPTGNGNQFPSIVVGLGNNNDTMGPSGLVEYYDGHSWNQLHDGSWRAPISHMAVQWTSGTPNVLVGLGLYLTIGYEWITGSPIAVENKTLVALFTNNAWIIQAAENNPVSAMNAVFCSSGLPPSIVFALGPNQADLFNFEQAGPDAFKIFWNSK